MARESRHLKISHIPEPIDQEKLLERFRSYGRVQKLELAKDEPGTVVVSFMDMRTASKALNAELTVDGHPVKASYYEPGSTGLSTTVIQIHDSDESVLHSAGPPASQESRRSGSGSGQHAGGGNKAHGRAANVGGRLSSGPSSSSTWHESGNYECGSGGGGGFREPLCRSNGLDQSSQQPRRPLSRLSGGAASGHVDRGGRKRSHSSGSPETADASSSPSSASLSRSQSPCGSPASRSLGGGRYAVDSRHQHGLRDDGMRGSSGSGCSQKEQATIVVRSLPRRSTDSSIKDGLFFTYKKHAKVVSVKVIGSGSDRYALVTFRRAPDAVKATSATNGEMFFGSRIMVEMAPVGLDGDDNERRPLEKDIDQYHMKSSRTLYVGNLENRITPEQLRHLFQQFGDVLDVDIKNRETPAPFAFVQFADIVSVVKAIHAMEQDGYIGNNKIKVGFGKPLPSPMVWLDELPSHVTEEYLTRKMKFYGTVTDVLIDKVIRQALVTYESIEAAQLSVTDMKGRTINGRKVQIDFCSRELHDLFVDRMFRCNKSQRGATANVVANTLCSAGPLPSTLLPTSSGAAGRPFGRKMTYDYYRNDSYYDSNSLRSNYGQRSGNVRSFDYPTPATSSREYNADYNAARPHEGFHSKGGRPRGRSVSPTRFSAGRYQHRQEETSYHEEIGRGATLQKTRLGRNSRSRSPPVRYGALGSSRDSSRDKARQRRPLARDDSANRRTVAKRPRTPPVEPITSPGDRKSSLPTRRSRHGQEEEEEGDHRQEGEQGQSSSSDDDSDSSSSPSTSSSSGNGASPNTGKRSTAEGKPKAQQGAQSTALPKVPSPPPPCTTDIRCPVPASSAITTANANKEPSPEMNKLQRERERLLQVIEHLASGDEPTKAVSAIGAGALTNAKPKLADVFDLDWVKAAAEQEQKTRRQSAAGAEENKEDGPEDKSPQQRSALISMEYEDHLDQGEGQLSIDDEEKGVDSEGQFKRKKRPVQLRSVGRSLAEGENGPDTVPSVIKSLDEPEQNVDKEPCAQNESCAQDNPRPSDNPSNSISGGCTAVGKGSIEAAEISASSGSKKSVPAMPKSSMTNKTKSIPLEPDESVKSTLCDPRTNPPDLERPRDLPLPSFSKRISLRHQHHRHNHGTALIGPSGAPDAHHGRPSTSGDTTGGKEHRMKLEQDGNSAEEAAQIRQVGGRPSHDQMAPPQSHTHANLRQRNSSASEQLSPLISSSGEFSATDSDGALMSPPGCGGADGSGTSRSWANPTVDIFGEALSPPQGQTSATAGAGQSGVPEGGASHRRSFEERIRALDAKFSALDQMIKGAIERPHQPIRQTSLTSAASGGSIDYSKYKVVKKPSLCGVPSSPSSSAPVEGILNKPAGGLLNSHCRTSAFDYDTQRLLGNLPGANPPRLAQSGTCQAAPVHTPESSAKMDHPFAPAGPAVRTVSVPSLTSPPCELTCVQSAADQSRNNVRPLSIAISPAPLSSSSSSSAPTPSGGTPLSPTGVPLQGILKNKPRTPTGDGSQQHQDPRTAARKESVKSPIATCLESPSVPASITSNTTAKPLTNAAKLNVGQPHVTQKHSVTGFGNPNVMNTRPATEDVNKPAVHQRPDIRQLAGNRGSAGITQLEQKTDKSFIMRPVDRSHSTSSIYAAAANLKSTIDGHQKSAHSAAGELRKMSTPVTSSATATRAESGLASLKELRNKESDERLHSESRSVTGDSEHDGGKMRQLAKLAKKEKTGQTEEKSRRHESVITKEKKVDKDVDDKERDKSHTKPEQKDKAPASMSSSRGTEKEKDRKLSIKAKVHQDVQKRHSSSASSETSSMAKRDKDNNRKTTHPVLHKHESKEKTKTALGEKPSVAVVNAKPQASTNISKSKTTVKQKSRGGRDGSGAENSGPSEKGGSSGSDGSSDDESDDGRRTDKKLAKEWKEVLELSIMGEEPAGLSMYDRVKRRSSASYTDPWKQKASKGSSTAGASSSSGGSKTDKFLLLKEKRAKHSQKLATGSTKKRTIAPASSGEENDTDDEEDQSALSGAADETPSESSDEEAKRNHEEERQRRKAMAKKMQQNKKQQEHRSIQKRSTQKSSAQKIQESKDKMRLSIADVFSSEASSASESEGGGEKKRSGKQKEETNHRPAVTHEHKASEKVKKKEEARGSEKDKKSVSSEKRSKQEDAKRGPGRPPKPTKGDGSEANASLKKERQTLGSPKGDTKEASKGEDGAQKKQKRVEENQEERRLRKKRKMEKMLAQKFKNAKEKSATENRGSVTLEQRSQKRTKEEKPGLKRVRTNDSESQPDASSAKKKRKISSPVGSPNSNAAISTVGGMSASVPSSTSGHLVTKAAVKQVETPAVTTSSPSPQPHPPKLLTKAAMKAVDTRKPQNEEPQPKALEVIAEIAKDPPPENQAVIDDVAPEREEKEVESGDIETPVEVSVQEEVVEAVVQIDLEEAERQAELAAVKAIEKDLRAKEESELASIAQIAMERASFDAKEQFQMGIDAQAVVAVGRDLGPIPSISPSLSMASCAVSTDGSQGAVLPETQPTVQQASVADDKTKPLSVDVDNISSMDGNTHEALSEQKSDVSHVDEIIDDVVHGYVEIDAEKLIKMSNAASKAAAAAAAANAVTVSSHSHHQNVETVMSLTTGPATGFHGGTGMPNFQSSTSAAPAAHQSLFLSSVQNQMQPSCARMDASPAVSQQEAPINSQQHSDLALRQQQQRQQQQQQQFQQHQLQKTAEMGLQFSASGTQRFQNLNIDASSMSRPITLGNEGTGLFATQQAARQQQQPLQHGASQQQQQQQLGANSGSNLVHNFPAVTSQQTPLNLGFSLTPSTPGPFSMVPRPQQPHQQRITPVTHHQFMATTPVTPSANQAPPQSSYPLPLTTTNAPGLTSGLPSYAAAAAAAQQQYAAFLELQQKQAAWASANLLQQTPVAGANSGVVNIGGNFQQPRYSTANTSGAQAGPGAAPAQTISDQGQHFREYATAERQQQQQCQQQQQQQQQMQPAAYHPPQQMASTENNRVPRLLNTYPIVWQGCLVLKNDSALVQMHYVDGAQHLIRRSMPDADEGSHFAVLRISQRMRLENQQLEGVHRRMQLPEEHCVLVALPCGQNRVHIAEQGSILQNAFINYLTQKQAAGIVNVTQPGSNQTSHVVHIFPPCEFSDNYLMGSASDFLRSIRDHDTSYLFVVITTVVQVM